MPEITMERFLKWSPDEMTTQAASLTATVTGAMTGAFAVWLGSEKSNDNTTT